MKVCGFLFSRIFFFYFLWRIRENSEETQESRRVKLLSVGIRGVVVEVVICECRGGWLYWRFVEKGQEGRVTMTSSRTCSLFKKDEFQKR